MDINFIEGLGIADILDGLIVVSCPEEGDVSIGDQLAKHVEGSMSTLVLGDIVMLNPDSLPSRPVGE